MKGACAKGQPRSRRHKYPESRSHAQTPFAACRGFTRPAASRGLVWTQYKSGRNPTVHGALPLGTATPALVLAERQPTTLHHAASDSGKQGAVARVWRGLLPFPAAAGGSCLRARGGALILPLGRDEAISGFSFNKAVLARARPSLGLAPPRDPLISNHL